MEASTQPQQALPAPTPSLQTNIPESDKSKTKMALIITAVLFIGVIIILVILLILSRNSADNTTNATSDVVDNTIMQQTTAAPETSNVVTGSNIDTSSNTFEARLFYLGFDTDKTLTNN